MGFTDMWGVDWSQQYAPRKTTPTTPGITSPGTAPGTGFGTSTGSTTSYTPDYASIAQITQLVNDINQKAQQAANAGRIPNGAGLEQTSSGNINTALRGQLPQDVITQLGEQAAQHGVSTGSPTGPSTNAAYLKAIGLNSLGLMGTGQEWLSAATARNPAAPIYNAGNQVLTPEQVAQIDIERQRLQLERERNDIARMAALNRGHYGGGGLGGGGTTTLAPNAGRRTVPNLFLPEDQFTSGARNVTTSTTYPQVNPDSGNWFDQALWENATPTNTGFDPYAGNWWDDPFKLDNSSAGNNWMDEMLWNEATPVP